jgi:hypothetical protein
MCLCSIERQHILLILQHNDAALFDALRRLKTT